MYYDILFHGFDERREDLEKKTRFRDYPTMFYRANLEDHSLMVSWFVQELLPYAKERYPDHFDERGEKEALIRALVHDDFEIITGDVSRYVKDKMNDKQKTLFDIVEEKAIEKLVARFPEKIDGFEYKWLLETSRTKDTIIAQFVSYCDKVVGYGEVLHELYAGNEGFVTSKRGDDASKRCWKMFKSRNKGFGLVSRIFKTRHPLLNIPRYTPSERIVKDQKPHTKESIKEPTGNKFYDAWRNTMIKHGRKRGLELLLTQKEQKRAA